MGEKIRFFCELIIKSIYISSIFQDNQKYIYSILIYIFQAESFKKSEQN